MDEHQNKDKKTRETLSITSAKYLLLMDSLMISMIITMCKSTKEVWEAL